MKPYKINQKHIARANKNLKLNQKFNNQQYEHHAFFAQILRTSDELYLHEPPVLHSTAKKRDVESYEELFPRKKGLYKMLGVSDNTLHIIQDGLENTILIYRKMLTPAWKWNGDDKRIEDEPQRATEEEERSKMDFKRRPEGFQQHVHF